MQYRKKSNSNVFNQIMLLVKKGCHTLRITQDSLIFLKLRITQASLVYNNSGHKRLKKILV